MKEYNEDEAILHMRRAVAGAETYDSDQLLNLIDIIFDYYDENGDLEIDIDDENDSDIDDIAAYASKMLAADPGNEISHDHIAALIAAEINYELSLI